VPSDHTEVHRVGQVMATAIKKATSIEYTVGNSATLLYPAAGTYNLINIINTLASKGNTNATIAIIIFGW